MGRWGIFKWPQVGDFGWPPGIADLTSTIVKEAHGFSFPDIFDRLIIATARCLGAPIVTCDERIKSAGLVQVVWE